MGIILKIILAIILMTQLSCITLLSVALTPLKSNCDKEKIMISNTNAKMDLKTNGFYISDSNGLFFLFNNGLFYQYSSFSPKYAEYLEDKQKFLEKLRVSILEPKVPEKWGEWNKTDSLITLRYFTWHYNYGFCKRIVLGMDGVVLNDSTIQIHTEYAFNDGVKEIFENVSMKEYHFEYYDMKPDSSDVWFLDKKWYKKRIMK